MQAKIRTIIYENSRDKTRTKKKQRDVKPRIAEVNRDLNENSQDKPWLNQEQRK